MEGGYGHDYQICFYSPPTIHSVLIDLNDADFLMGFMMELITGELTGKDGKPAICKACEKELYYWLTFIGMKGISPFIEKGANN